jgi:3-oxoacyl-[acyl-carrier protein] reductase
MNPGLRNKVALIGGGSKGLGKGCAMQLAREGVRIALCARGAQALEKSADEIRRAGGVSVLPLSVDLSRPADVRKAVKDTLREFGRIDILVANSGGPVPGGFFDMTEKDWRKGFDSVLYYVIELYRLVIPCMKKQKWGRIINITSLTVKEPAESLILSNVFRAGVVSLAKSLSRELIAYNITINNVCPGAFKTDRVTQLMLAQSKKSGIPVSEIEKKTVGTLPLGRYQDPEELGDLAVFLASEQARGITGTTICADGGISRGLF